MAPKSGAIGQSITAPGPPQRTDAAAELYAKFFRGLGDPTRVKIIQLLLERPRTVSELVALLGAPQGRVRILNDFHSRILLGERGDYRIITVATSYITVAAAVSAPANCRRPGWRFCR